MSKGIIEVVNGITVISPVVPVKKRKRIKLTPKPAFIWKERVK